MKKNQIVVKVATNNTRGFLKNLFDYPFDNIEFVYEDKSVYEIPNRLKLLLSKIITWRIFDLFGIFQQIKVDSSNCDFLFSYNRFLKTDKPYYIFLENPSALVNYCWDRPKHLITKIKLKKLFNDNNLKGIVCMSKACYSYFPNLYGDDNRLKRLQIYPLVEDDVDYGRTEIHRKSNEEKLECLFISSNFELKGGRDIIEVFKRIREKGHNIHLSVITRKSSIRQEDIQIIKSMDCIDLIEFNLSKSKLNEYYKKSAILLNPTRMDSFSLVTLEAIKYGCAVIASDVYAIKEMDRDGYNGYLGKSMFKIWNEDGSRNKVDMIHPERTVLSGVIDQKLVEWMFSKINFLYENRTELESMCNNSLNLARESEFSEKYISRYWENLIHNDLINEM